MLTKHKKIIFPLFLIACLFLNSNCGFKLQGDSRTKVFPLCDVLLLVEEGNQTLDVAIREQLSIFGVKVAQKPDEAKYILRIKNDKLSKRLNMVSSGKTTRQYEMIYRIFFEVSTVLGQSLTLQKSATIFRTLTINNNGLLGSNHEEAMLKSEMQLEAINKLFQMLKRIKPQAKMPHCY